MALLGVVINVAVGLWTRSMVDSVAYDAARDVATSPTDADPAAVRIAAVDRATAALGDYGRRVRFDFESGVADEVVSLRVRAPANNLLPSLITGGSILGSIDHRVVVRREAT